MVAAGMRRRYKERKCVYYTCNVGCWTKPTMAAMHSLPCRPRKIRS